MSGSAEPLVRPASAPDGPVLSVVVPSVNGFRDLQDCLAALERERVACPLEVLVVDRCGAAVRSATTTRFPWVILLEVGPAETIPEMRLRAFERASAPMVAVIEDHVIVPPGWARAISDALRAEDGPTRAVVGGSVVNGATAGTVDWAAFLCEYSHCLPPLASGPSTWLTGNNVVYPRDVLLQHREALGADRWENVLHDALRSSGVTLVCRPDIPVVHKKHYSVGEYASQRYLYSRAYAGARLAGSSRTARLVRGAGAFLLPPVLYARVVQRVRRSGAHSRELRQSLPLLALFVVAWAAGEVVGAWFGGGDALERVC